MKNIALIFSLFFLFAATVFLDHYLIVGNGVWGDGRYYYTHARSIIVDRDINYKEEFEHFKMTPVVVPKTGRVANKLSLGPALLWLPFLKIAHLLTGGDGYSHFYQVLTGLGAVFYGTLGLFICFKLAREFFSDQISLVATLGIWLASNLFFYTAVDPINSHAVSFFVSSLLIYVWHLFLKKRRIWRLAVLGFLVGILAMIRSQDIIFALPILVSLFYASGKDKWLKIGKYSLVFLIFIILALLPQLILWKIIYGELNSPYFIQGDRFINWQRPKIGAVLFGANNGLFYYSPVLIFSLIGLIILKKKNHFLSPAGLGLFTIQLYVVSSWNAWWGGAAYGGRMFISLMPFFILGLAAFIDCLDNKKKAYFFLPLLAIFNFISIILFLLISP